ILDVAISRGSIAMVTLPAVNTLPVDRELINLVVGMIRRLLARGFSYQDDGEIGSLSPEDIGVVVSRRAQVGALTQALSSIGNIYVETANRFQGLQHRVVFTLHPLSGKIRPDEFSIHSGRMCVATTRHRICCVIVGREGIGESLGRYVPDDDRFLGQQNDPVFLGWKAHELLLSELERTDRIVKAA
ncbi:MAG: AAA domain-containing protein, partial [bacterium]|nr:AAA domain-containing protein [bacterium]